MDQGWHWEGSLWSFLDVVRWALVYYRLGKDHSPGWSTIMSSPEKVRAKAEQFGLTYRAIANEMIRLGTEGISMLDMLDAMDKDETCNHKQPD